MNKNNEFFNYSNSQHMSSTKRLKYQKIIKNHKNKIGISKIEKELVYYNSKTCCFDKFKKYINKKNEVNNKLLSYYAHEKFRQYKWYSYINKNRTDTNLIREIKNKFHNTEKEKNTNNTDKEKQQKKYKDTVIIMGDWNGSSQSTIKHISTPNIRLKRKLSEYFTIYNLDEFRTSCLHYKSEERCKNLYLDIKGKTRKMHSILTYTTESKRMGCINRDKNAVNNMIKIVNQYLLNKTRPEKFERSYKFDNIDHPPIIQLQDCNVC